MNPQVDILDRPGAVRVAPNYGPNSLTLMNVFPYPALKPLRSWLRTSVTQVCKVSFDRIILHPERDNLVKEKDNFQREERKILRIASEKIGETMISL